MNSPETGAEDVAPVQVNGNQLAALRQQIRRMANPDTLMVPDIFMRGFHQAMDIVFDDSDFAGFTQIVQERLRHHPSRTPANAANLLMRSGQDYKLRNGYPGYPLRHQHPENWLDFPAAVQEQPQELEHLIINDTLNVQTNVPDRGLLAKAAAHLLEIEEPVNMLDVGCSRHHISKKLAYPDRDGFTQYRHTDVMDGQDVYLPNYGASYQFNKLIQDTPLAIGCSIGIDLQDMLIGDTKREADKLRQWGEHCFYPSERLFGAERIREYRHWEQEDKTTAKTVRFFQGDITEFDHERFRAQYPHAKDFDIGYFSTVGYQLGHDGMQAAIENLRPYLRPDGHIFLQDFVEIQPDGKMDFLQDWPRWSYGLYVLDLAKEEEGFKKFFTVESGRVGKVIVEEAAGRLAVARQLGLGQPTGA